MFLLTWCSLFLCNNLTMHCARTGSLELLMRVLPIQIAPIWNNRKQKTMHYLLALFHVCSTTTGLINPYLYELLGLF